MISRKQNPLKVVVPSAIIFLLQIGCSIYPVAASTIATSGILAHPGNAREMALDQDNIYWIVESGHKNNKEWIDTNKIERIRKTGGKINTLMEETLDYYHLTVDDNYLYWVASDSRSSQSKTESIEKIEKKGGKSAILFTEKATIGDLIQDNDHIYTVLESGDTQLIQIKKSTGSVTVIDSNNGYIEDYFIHNNYIYWKVCGWRLENCGIKRELIGSKRIETIIAKEDYGYPYNTESGIYWLGDSLIYLDDSTDKISSIFSYNIFTEPTSVVGPGGIETETYISNVLYINENGFYFSERGSAVPGFSSCTDESEGIIKINRENLLKNNIGRIRGEANYYGINQSVILYSFCSDVKVLNLKNDIMSDEDFGGIKIIIADALQIYWINNSDDLVTKAIGGDY